MPRACVHEELSHLQGSKKDHEPTEVCDAKKFFYYVKETNPQNNLSSNHLPLAGSHYPLQNKLEELHYRQNIFVPIGIPYLVKSTRAVHGFHHEKTRK